MSDEKQSVKILNIYISELFGYKEIKIDISQNDNLVVLYGDNGSGKTTVLYLLYHIFSSEPAKGHRTAIGNTVFKSIHINLSGNIDLILERVEIKSDSYNVMVREAGEIIVNWKYYPNFLREDKGENRVEYDKYCALMERLKFNIFYLPASRRTDKDDMDNGETIIIQDSENVRRRIYRQDNETPLTKALRQFQQWARREMIKKTSVGYRTINDLYNEIIDGIRQDKKTTDDFFKKENILKRISDIDLRNKEYKKYGLSEDFLNDEIVETLKKSSEDNTLRQIVTILTPYLESIILRLKSLEELQLLLSKFEENINDLFTEKKIVVSVEDGIVIESPTGHRLEPQKLSSGEQQLLLIFCNVIASRSNSQLIIIDEPEISLNVKWQRKFINSILDIIDKKNTQLFIATHSIEMLNKYQDNIHQLGSKNECPT